MDSNYDGGPAIIVAMLTIYAVVIVFAVAFALALYVLMAFALMSFFRKVGVAPWIAWVPFYNTWKWLEVGGQSGYWSLLALIPYGRIATAVFLCIGMYRTGIAFRKDVGFLVLGIFLPFVWAFILGGRAEVYEPELIARAGYPPPLAGFGSAASSAAPTAPAA